MAADRNQLQLAETEDGRVVTARLSRAAEDCYRLFCDGDRLGEWLTVVGTVVVRQRDERGRPREAAFTGHLLRASIGYTLVYDYDDDALEVRWRVRGDGQHRLAGAARFTPAGPNSCVMRYSLTSELPPHLPRWADSFHDSRPARAVVMDFCAWVEREP